MATGMALHCSMSHDVARTHLADADDCERSPCNDSQPILRVRKLGNISHKTSRPHRSVQHRQDEQRQPQAQRDRCGVVAPKEHNERSSCGAAP
jgi:hypothetical protein